jgi:hypothetical protein
VPKSNRRWTAGIWVSIALGVAGGVAGVLKARGKPPLQAG